MQIKNTVSHDISFEAVFCFLFYIVSPTDNLSKKFAGCCKVLFVWMLLSDISGKGLYGRWITGVAWWS